MSAPVFNDDFRLGGEISRPFADAAREEVVADTMQQAEGKPVTFRTHKVKTRSAANEFLQNGDKTALAQILRIPISEVHKRYRGSEPGVCNTTICTVSPGRTDWAYTLLALGDLSFENGLPALGSSEVKYELKSGEALHFLGDVKQTYSGTGGGTLIWFYWSNLSGAS